MFRTWLILPGQSVPHKLELLVSHLTLEHFKYVTTRFFLQAMWSNVYTIPFSSL